MDLIRIAAGLAVVAASAAPALARAKLEDPNRQICRSKAAIGSRLQRIRECHTAAEWEDMKRAERIGLMSKQYNGDEAEGVNELKMPERMTPQ